MDAKDELESAKINAAYKNGEDGTAHKVERLTAKIAALRAELNPAAATTPAAQSTPATTPATSATPVATTKPATRPAARMIVGKLRTHADAIKFAKNCLSGAQKESFLAQTKAAFPELY